jgi:O-antigen/teichoic acid export membrane protein
MPASKPSASQLAGQRAALNTIVRAVGEVTGKVASLFLFASIGRTLGEDGLGTFVLALAFATIVLIPIDLGLDRGLLREVAADRKQAGPLAANVVVIKLVILLPAIGLAFFVLSFFDYSAELRTTIAILLLATVLESMGRTAAHLFMAVERSVAITVSIVAQRFVAAALGIAGLAAGLDITAVAWAYTLGSLVGLVVLSVALLRQVPLPGMRASRSDARLLMQTMTFALQDIAGLLLFRLDAVILSVLATTAAVGRYGAAYRIFEATWFISVSLIGAFSAMFTYLDHRSEPTLRSTFERALKLALVTLMPCSLAFGLCAPAIIDAMFGEKLSGAVDALRLLAPVVLLLGVGALTTTLLMSQRRPRPVLWISLVAVLVNVGLNFALVPDMGAEGAAVAMLATEALLALAALVVAHGVLGALSVRNVMVGPTLAGGAMTLTIVLLSGGLAALALGIVAYVAVLAAAERMLNPDEARAVTAMMRRWMPRVSPS